MLLLLVQVKEDFSRMLSNDLLFSCNNDIIFEII